MKTFLLFAMLAACMNNAVAQSESIKTLQNTFAEHENVHSIRASGFLARTVLWLAGEQEIKKAIRKVRNVRVVTVPKAAFEHQKVTVRGFRRIVRRDSYEEVASVREKAETVTIYLQDIKNSSLNRYLILIDNPNQFVAVEVKGYVDTDLLKNSNPASLKNL